MQSTFIALNIEPDDDTDDEIDDTKEIQIEEALKLYQTALKLHSQGPPYYDQAEQAYLVLFNSEIFKYPESLSESKHLERYGQAQDAEELDHEDTVHDLTAGTTTADGTPSTLPQILYLTYKNYGQFKLDYLKHQIETVKSLPKEDLIDKVAAILLLFAEALERDDTDAVTWRHTSRIGGLLGSTRIARFCLEAVLDANETDIDDAMERSGLEEAFAVEELKELLGTLTDELSQSQQPLSLLLKRTLPSSLAKHSKLSPFLHKQAHLLSSNGIPSGSWETTPTKLVLHATARTWAAVGKLIVGKLTYQHLVSEQYISTEFGPGAGFVLELPGNQLPNKERSLLDGTDSTTEPVVLVERRAQTASLEAVSDRHRAGGAHARKDRAASRGGGLTVSHGHDVSKFDGNAPEPQPVEEFQNSSIRPNKDGQSTPQQIAPNDAGELVQEFAETSCTHQVKLSPSLNTLTLPTRKRSSDSAGNQEPVDGGRIRSKRIRARESVADAVASEEATGTDIARYVSDQLEALTRADHWMFEVVNGLLSKLGVLSLGSLDELKTCIDDTDEVELVSDLSGKENQRQRCTAIQDLRQILQTWTDEKGNIILAGNGVEDASSNIGRARNSGLTIFLEHSKRQAQKATTRPLLSADVGLARFQEDLERNWLCINEVAFRWIKHLLLPTAPTSGRTRGGDAVLTHPTYGSTYTDYTWPEPLKEAIVQILVGQDDYIYKAMEGEACQLEFQILCASMKGRPYRYSINDHFTAEMVETIFELHLDVYSSITNPSSEVDMATRILQRYRLSRWTRLASNLLRLRPTVGEGLLATDTLTLRYLWAATFFSNMSEGVSREHVMLCLAELNQLLEAAGNPVLELQNNAVMPEVSAAAAEREMSRLTTMDFFLGIFSNDDGSPVAVIESLEPILDPMKATTEIDSQDAQQSEARAPDNDRDSLQVDFEKVNMSDTPQSDLRSYPTQLDEMSRFLQRGSASLRLFLWRRLRDAYEAINYPPRIFSCCLRSIEIIMTDLKSASYLESAPEHRQLTLLKWIRCLDDLTVKALTLVLDEPSALECMDVEQLQVSMTAFAELSRLLHSFTMYEDSVRVGQVKPTSSSTHPSMLLFANKLREMQVRTWIIQYVLLKAAISQNQGVFVVASDDLVDYLRVVHYVLGSRSYCKLANKVFLKFMKAELLVLCTAETWESDFAQVIYDLHGLKLCPSFADLQDHGCPADPLDGRTAIQIMDFVMKQVKKINIKDLPKTDLKSIIDKMQQFIGAPKQTNALTLNRRILMAFLKSPINPIDLYRSLKGVGDLSTVPVGMESAVVAEKGWYFLLGSMAFHRFCSQKRVAPGPTDDLDFADYFFKLDLEYNMDKWETWYRLAVVYDTQLEEDVLWSAEKINSNNNDLTDLQRRAIHCYTMALATAVRCADDSTETASKVSDLYTNFGFRVYASTREPFSMEAFSLRDFTRFFSAQSQGMYKKRPFRDLKLFPAWTFAAVLFRKALVEKPERWINHYMLAKCLWKMYSCEDSIAKSHRRPDYQEVLEACVQAIDTLPERKDNRQEAILEPHYKLVTIVHKLVKRRKLKACPLEASDFLLTTPYARKIPPPEDLDSWETYILQILKALRTADKSNWHHRMVARAAHIIYDDSADDVTAAMGAKHEFTQQIFTKTMTLQVWKPEHERAGRHFVYTSRYVSFFVRLLVQLGDRASLEALTKRVRKKAGEYVGFAKLWHDLCLAYLKLLRRLGHILEGHEDTVFKSISHEEFQVNASRLETWCHLPDTYSQIIDILRDVVELKKLNTSLMKPTLIDDLIFDTYAMLYGTVVPELAAKASGQESRERMRVDHLLMSTDDSVATPPPPATMTPDPAAIKPRTKGVGRKELLRKAEAVVTKPSAAPEVSRVSSAAESSVSQQIPQEVSIVKEERGKEDAQGSSAPGSVHDSADDESELSEIEEELPVPVVKPMFPNLVNSGGATGSAADSSEKTEGGSPRSPLKDLDIVDGAGTADQ